jgi:hypothetical protein
MTDEEEKIHENRHYGQLNDGHKLQMNQSAFVGAMIRYCWYLGRRKMSEFEHPKERFKNAFVSSILGIVLLIGIFGALYYLYR